MFMLTTILWSQKTNKKGSKIFQLYCKNLALRMNTWKALGILALQNVSEFSRLLSFFVLFFPSGLVFVKARASHIFQNPGIDTECSFNKIFLITAVFSGTYVEIESIQNSTQTLWSRKITLIYIEHEASCRHTQEY